MTVRFKNQSEYQKSYGVPRSRSASPQRRRRPLAGLHSDQTGIGRQRRERPGPLGAAQSCSSLLGSPGDPVPRRAPSAGRNEFPASKSFSAHKNPTLRDSKPPKVSGSAPQAESPSGPRPTAEIEPPPKPEPGSSLKLMIDGKPVKLRPSEPEPSGPVTAPAPVEQPGNQVDRRPGGHRSEYHRQFGWKKPVSGVSPLLTAEQVLHSSSRSIPPFKKNPVPMETEYRRSFRGLIPPSGPRLRRHLEHQRAPVFHTYRKDGSTSFHRRKSLEPQNELPPKLETPQRDNNGSQSPPRTTARPAQVQRRRRMLTEYQSSFRSPLCRNTEGGGATDDIAEQVKELRRQALTYRHRAWGTNFSRNHLSQLLSEYNALWEPTDTTDSHTDPSTPCLNPEPDSHSASCVEALDLASNSSRKSSVGAGGKTQGITGTETPPVPGAERQTAWEEEEDKEEEIDEQEGRLPTPKLKTRPVQRTHHDLTTPATGGAILVGKLTNMEDSSSSKQKQKFRTAVSPDSGSEAAVNKPTKVKEAWSENASISISPAPINKETPSLQPKPTRVKQASPSPAVPPPLTSPPQHGIQGMLRHPDFQHNGELGLRFKEPPCSRGGCSSDEDDRLSAMSWRSGASCAAASAILERAQKRRENFWGKEMTSWK